MYLTRYYFCEPCVGLSAVAAIAELHQYQPLSQEARRTPADGDSMLYLIRHPISSNLASYVQCNDRDPSPCLMQYHTMLTLVSFCRHGGLVRAQVRHCKPKVSIGFLCVLFGKDGSVCMASFSSPSLCNKRP